MPPLWKVRREAKRLYAKLLDLPERAVAGRRQRRYDRTKALRIAEGAVPTADEHAVLLLFPAEGVPRSTFDTLDHLRRHAIAPTVVSNLPLSGDDRAALLRGAHLVIERPNRGYDFGGYRDGVLALIERGAAFQRLFVLNDSIWFPLNAASTLIEDSRAHPADLFGIYLNRRDGQPHRTHLQSYFYRFGPRICGSGDLEAVWRDLVTYNSKDLTVRRCEMRLTHGFRERGHAIGQLYTIEDLHRAIAALEGADRTALLDYLIAVGDKHAAHHRAMRERGGEDGGTGEGGAADDAAWRRAALSGRLGRFPLATHPTVLLEGMGFPVIKRDKQPMYRLQRREALHPRYEPLLSPTVRAEMAERV